MANFIFNSAAAAITAATLDLSTGNYYAHLVTAVPILANTTVANLTLPTTPGYASAPLTGLSYNATRWTFDSFSFPVYTFASVPTGVVICKRDGASPASTDQIICYSDFNNSIGQVITLTVGSYIVNLAFGVNGAINFSYMYQYSSGAYNSNAGALPPGLIDLIGTKNNTVAYVNPFSSANSIPHGSTLGDKSLTSVDNGVTTAIDFGSISIRPGVFAVSVGTNQASITLSASNNIGVFNTTNINNNSLWTTLTTQAIVNGWNLITVSNTTYWRYFRVVGVGGSSATAYAEIELYNSWALSPTINFV